MERWDTQMRQARLRERMQKLAPPSLTVFTLGCTTHARDVLIRLTESRVTESRDPTVYQSASRLLDQFWSNYPDVLGEKCLHSYANRAGALVPDEDTDLAPGEGALLWSLLYAFKCHFGTDVIMEAMNAVSDAYHAVFAFQYERGEFSRDDDEIAQLEADSEPCLDEIRFQLRFLERLERGREIPPSYSELVMELTNDE